MSNISQVSINQTSSDPGKPPQQARQVFHPRYSPHPPHFSFLPFLFSRSFIPSFITLSLLSFFFFTYIPPSLGTFLHFYYIHLFFLSIQFLLSSLLPFAPLLLYTSLNPASLSLSLLSHSPTFLSASFTLHQEVHTSDESDCDDDLVPKTGMEVHTHTHTLCICRKRYKECHSLGVGRKHKPHYL